MSLKPDDGLVPSAFELETFQYIKRRLSFLVKEDRLFDEIDEIEHKKYKGKFVVFYKRERAGRIFDFYEGKAKKYTFDFGQGGGGDISTENLAEVDKVLGAAFSKRVQEGEVLVKRPQLAKSA
jgi:hypothetical protein